MQLEAYLGNPSKWFHESAIHNVLNSRRPVFVVNFKALVPIGTFTVVT